MLAMLLPVLRATWHRRGEQPKVLTPGQNRKRPIFGICLVAFAAVLFPKGLGLPLQLWPWP